MTEKCRICLQESAELMENLFENESLHQKLIECVNLNLDNQESLPTKICELCKSKLVLAHHFKELCLKSQNDLKFLNCANNVDTTLILPNSENSHQEVITGLLKRTDQEIILIIEENPNLNKSFNSSQKEVVEEDSNKISVLEIEGQSSQEVKDKNSIETSIAQKKKQSKISRPKRKNIKVSEEEQIDSFPDVESIKIIEDGKVKYKKKCPKCGILQINLKQHYLVHSQIKRYECKYCEKKFSQIGNYKTHLNLHTGKRPHVCQLCSNSFSDPNSLRVHMIRHSGEKKYKCGLCSKSFGYAHTLTVHKLSHSQIRNFECFICQKRFNTKYSIKKHMRVHTGEKPFSCIICEKSFCTSGNLRTHQLVHSKIKRFSCELCSFKCSYKCVLNVHVKKTHNKT